MRGRAVPGAAFALTLMLTACGAASKPTPAPTPSPAPEGPRVVMPSGAVYSAELARTPEEQAQGLMFRESLPPRHGMLFLFAKPNVHKFWMKNTMIPLDMIWLDREGRVIFVSADTPPCKADPCPSYGPDAPAVTVLEIAGGMATKEAVKPGSLLKLINVP